MGVLSCRTLTFSRFLIKQGKHDKAAKSLSRLRRLDVDHPALVEELAEIEANHEYEMSIGTSSYLACFQKPIRKRLFTGCALQALQQLTGVNFIFYYGTSYFQTSGIGNPFIISVITDVVNVCSTVPGLYLVEKWGRRSLLMFGAIGMSVSQLIVASVGTALPDDKAANKALIAFVCIYIFFFACSWGPCGKNPASRLGHRGPMLTWTSLGCHWRNLPTEGSSKRSLNDHGIQLASKLGHCIRDTLHGQQWTGQRVGFPPSPIHEPQLTANPETSGPKYSSSGAAS